MACLPHFVHIERGHFSLIVPLRHLALAQGLQSKDYGEYPLQLTKFQSPDGMAALVVEANTDSLQTGERHADASAGRLVVIPVPLSCE
jgi:hypothetical protein